MCCACGHSNDKKKYESTRLDYSSEIMNIFCYNVDERRKKLKRNPFEWEKKEQHTSNTDKKKFLYWKSAENKQNA